MILNLGNDTTRYFDLRKFQHVTGPVKLHFEDGVLTRVEEPPPAPVDWHKERSDAERDLENGKRRLTKIRIWMKEAEERKEFSKIEHWASRERLVERDVKNCELTFDTIDKHELEALKIKIPEKKEALKAMKKEISELERTIKEDESRYTELQSKVSGKK